MKYGRLVGVYDRPDATPWTLGRTEFPADASDAGGLLPEHTRLVRGRPVAPGEPGDAGVSPPLTARAMADATGVSDERVGPWWRGTGDLGDATARAVESRRVGGDGR